MPETLITSRSNPWVQQWLRYQAKPALRKAEGVVWLEGEHLVTEALKRCDTSFFSLETLALPDTEAGRAQYQRLCEQFDYARNLSIVWLGESVYKALCSMDSLPTVSAVLQLSASEAALDYQTAAVVLDGVQDPGNVGTIIRLCAAFGVPQVLLSEGCASAWSPKALRAGQGAQLALNIIEDMALNTAYSGFKAAGASIAATSLAKGSVPLQQAKLSPHMVWVFGSEGQGISAASQAAAQQLVHIPMQGGFESLNVGAAAAICLWQWQASTPKR